MFTLKFAEYKSSLTQDHFPVLQPSLVEEGAAGLCPSLHCLLHSDPQRTPTLFNSLNSKVTPLVFLSVPLIFGFIMSHTDYRNNLLIAFLTHHYGLDMGLVSPEASCVKCIPTGRYLEGGRYLTMMFSGGTFRKWLGSDRVIKVEPLWLNPDGFHSLSLSFSLPPHLSLTHTHKHTFYCHMMPHTTWGLCQQKCSGHHWPLDLGLSGPQATISPFFIR